MIATLILLALSRVNAVPAPVGWKTALAGTLLASNPFPSTAFLPSQPQASLQLRASLQEPTSNMFAANSNDQKPHRKTEIFGDTKNPFPLPEEPHFGMTHKGEDYIDGDSKHGVQESVSKFREIIKMLGLNQAKYNDMEATLMQANTKAGSDVGQRKTKILPIVQEVYQNIVQREGLMRYALSSLKDIVDLEPENEGEQAVVKRAKSDLAEYTQKLKQVFALKKAGIRSIRELDNEPEKVTRDFLEFDLGNAVSELTDLETKEHQLVTQINELLKSEVIDYEKIPILIQGEIQAVDEMIPLWEVIVTTTSKLIPIYTNQEVPRNKEMEKKKKRIEQMETLKSKAKLDLETAAVWAKVKRVEYQHTLRFVESTRGMSEESKDVQYKVVKFKTLKYQLSYLENSDHQTSNDYKRLVSEKGTDESVEMYEPLKTMILNTQQKWKLTEMLMTDANYLLDRIDGPELKSVSRDRLLFQKALVAYGSEFTKRSERYKLLARKVITLSENPFVPSREVGTKTEEIKRTGYGYGSRGKPAGAVENGRPTDHSWQDGWAE